MNHDLPFPSRIVWLDIVRLTAMLMVIGVHCIDPFYISPTLGTLPEYKFWASVYGSLFRPSVSPVCHDDRITLTPGWSTTVRRFLQEKNFPGIISFFDMVGALQLIPVVYRSSRASEIHYRRFFLLCTRK